MRIWKFIIQPGPQNERSVPGTEVDLLGRPCPPIKTSGCLAVAIAETVEDAMRILIRDAENRGQGRLMRWIEIADVTSIPLDPITPGVVALSY